MDHAGFDTYDIRLELKRFFGIKPDYRYARFPHQSFCLYC